MREKERWRVKFNDVPKGISNTKWYSVFYLNVHTYIHFSPLAIAKRQMVPDQSDIRFIYNKILIVFKWMETKFCSHQVNFVL